MVDQIKNKLNSLSSSGSNNAVRTDAKQVKAQIQKLIQSNQKLILMEVKFHNLLVKKLLKIWPNNPQLIKFLHKN